MIGRTGLATVLASVASLILLAPSGASAATTVGQTGPNNTAGCFPAPSGGVQLSTSTTDIYTIPFDGVITSFSATTDAGGTPIKLLILRRVSGDVADDLDHLTYNVVANGKNFGTFSGPGPQTFPTRVPVQAGQAIGEYGALCLNYTYNLEDKVGFFIGAEPALGVDLHFGMTGFFTNAVRVNLSASLEADADHDGFGDETQDQCVGSAGPQNGCAVASTSTGQRDEALRKCKKKNKKDPTRRSSRSARRRRRSFLTESERLTGEELVFGRTAQGPVRPLHDR